MDRTLAEALRATLSAARENVREWLDEGLESWDAVPRPSPAVAEAGGTAALPVRDPDSFPADSLPSLGSDPGTAPARSAARLEDIRSALGDCQECRLAAGRTQIVFGDGAPDADLMLIGEGPGEQEDRRGIPFVGRAGELLTQMIERGLEIPRSCVYICNIVKCRPPDNRAPLADEVAACRSVLDAQIDAVQPKVILALGKPATSLLLDRNVAISRVRGTWQEYRGIPVMPTYHPAFLLRQYTEENRRQVWQDLKQALTRARERGGRFPELS
ncbi:uracil-DNA glycosylase [Myxococcota bacterium]|nr:uracil-DNA glycosylase [Myxococcota bacterium]MCZ7618637.1 uracil-DNA glycosylase [Myxococcota bacterium]